MRMYYIYKTTNIITGKSYIGQHEVPLTPEAFDRYLGSGIAIKAAIKKYGRKNFKKEILEYIEDDDKHEKTSERERYWIQKENTMAPNGYNISPGGEGGITPEIAKRSALTRKERGYKLSEETKHKISESNKGKEKSEEHKQHLSENHHTRKLHKILHEDGTITETFLAIHEIAKQYNTCYNTLIRHSAKKQFVNGIYLLDVDPSKHQCCNNEHDREKRRMLCLDPVVGDICTLCAMRNRKRKNEELYKNIVFNDCIIRRDDDAA